MGDVKDMFSKPSMSGLGDKLQEAYSDFPKDEFMQAISDEEWPHLELFARISHVARILGNMLPNDYQKSLEIIVSIVSECNEPQAMILPQYVVEFGIDRLGESVRAFEQITQYASCEFAVRPFIDKYPDEIFPPLLDWTQSDNEHIRRPASEGARRAIPWGSRLQTVNQKHDYAIPILEALKDDPSGCVRKSVQKKK